MSERAATVAGVISLLPRELPSGEASSSNISRKVDMLSGEGIFKGITGIFLYFLS